MGPGGAHRRPRLSSGTISAGALPLNDGADALGRLTQRVVHQMCVAMRRRWLRVAQQCADRVQTDACAGKLGCKRMSKIMDRRPVILAALHICAQSRLRFVRCPVGPGPGKTNLAVLLR